MTEVWDCGYYRLGEASRLRGSARKTFLETISIYSVDSTRLPCKKTIVNWDASWLVFSSDDEQRLPIVGRLQLAHSSTFRSRGTIDPSRDHCRRRRRRRRVWDTPWKLETRNMCSCTQCMINWRNFSCVGTQSTRSQSSHDNEVVPHHLLVYITCREIHVFHHTVPIGYPIRSFVRQAAPEIWSQLRLPIRELNTSSSNLLLCLPLCVG
jgi:hypothetical protein